MSKELPYFKFITSEWLDGDITLESFEAQGLFINICALYWSKEGRLYLSKVKKRFKTASEKSFNNLIDEGFIQVNDDLISICFLDEQIEERKAKSLTNSENGKKGGRPRKQEKTEKKPNAFNSESKKKANESQLEENRVEENRVEEKIIEYFPDDFLLNEKYIEFLNFRKAIKKPLKDVSIKANIKQLLKLAGNNSDVAIQIMEQSIANGWQGFFELKQIKNGNTKSEQQYFGATKIPKDYDPEVY